MSILLRLAVSTGQVINNGVTGHCNPNCPSSGGIGAAFATATNIILFIGGAGAIIMIIIGGLRYVISAGNHSAVNDAKNTVLYAVIGLAVAISGYALVSLVTGHFGV